MQNIKAIVLTYDKYRALTEHMISCYEELWPDHPFTFCIPYQLLEPDVESSRTRYFRAPADIKGTVNALLAGLDDEEIVYWCIDDKYPIRLDTQEIEKNHRLLRSETNSDVSGLLFCRCRGMLDNKNLATTRFSTVSNSFWLERVNYEQIWIHQYLKVKVLRYLFDSFPGHIPNAKSMDEMKQRVKKPNSHRLFVTTTNLAVFGESTSRGVITKNCMYSIKSHGLAPPAWASEVTQKEIIIGAEPAKPRYSFGLRLGKLFSRGKNNPRN